MSPARSSTAHHTTRSASRLVTSLGLLAAMALVAGACGGDDGATTATVATTAAPSATSAPATTDTAAPVESTSTTAAPGPQFEIVVTTSILGDLVARLAGDAATVTVVIPDGQDPHDFMPSAREAEAITSADLVVVNGLALEEGLVELVADAAGSGIPVFTATDHVTLRDLTGGDDGHDEHGHDDDHGHDGGDPHIWTAPLVMAEMVPALAAAVGEAIGADLSDAAAELTSALTALDGEVRTILSAIPAGECKLVTGHESFAYFADAYGCEMIGAVIPSLTTTAEATAREIAELQQLAAKEGVRAVFVEVGTSPQLAEQVSEAIGVPLVELPAVDLPDEGGYEEYMRVLATMIADALGGEA